MPIDLERQPSGLQEETSAPPEPSGRAGQQVRTSRPRRLLGVITLTVVGVLVGFALASSQSNGPAVNVAPPVDELPAATANGVASAAAAIAPSVVQISSPAGLGSGVVYTSDGLILTAAHVIDGIDTVEIRLADGRLLAGTVLGTHTPTDVGVISIEALDLPAAVLGYGISAQVGELAIAVGSPFGLDQTVTAGIVSAVSRNVNGVPMVQTDAAINPGNSGGPLVNAFGHVMGINDVIFTEGGGSDGIGFAIAIDVAIVVADQLVAGGDVELAALGAATVPDTTGSGGAVVGDVLANFPAADAGLLIGDRIVAVDDTRILDPGDLFAAIVMHRPGSSVAIGFIRDGQPLIIDVTLAGIER